MPHIPRQKRRAYLCAVNAIAICLPARRLTRVEFRRNLGHLQHSNRSRKNIVQSPHPVLGRDRGCGRETRNLRQRVHAGVGAAGTLGQYIFSTQSSNGRGKRALDRCPAGLHLPSGKIGAIIREDQSEITHVAYRILARWQHQLSIFEALPPPSQERGPASDILFHLQSIYLRSLLTLNGKDCFSPTTQKEFHRKIARNSCPSFCVLANG